MCGLYVIINAFIAKRNKILSAKVSVQSLHFIKLRNSQNFLGLQKSCQVLNALIESSILPSSAGSCRFVWLLVTIWGAYAFSCFAWCRLWSRQQRHFFNWYFTKPHKWQLVITHTWYFFHSTATAASADFSNLSVFFSESPADLLSLFSNYNPLLDQYLRLDNLALWPLFLFLSLSSAGHSRWFRFRRGRWLKICTRSSNTLTFKRKSRLNTNPASTSFH